MSTGTIVTRRGLLNVVSSVLALWLFGAQRATAGKGRVKSQSAAQAGESVSEGRFVEPVSLALMQIMCAHCAAYAELGRISKRTDTIALGHAPAPIDLERLDALSDTEGGLFMDLCRYPADNDAERQQKATYLLAFCDGHEFEREHIVALLSSMSGRS